MNFLECKKDLLFLSKLIYENYQKVITDKKWCKNNGKALKNNVLKYFLRHRLGPVPNREYDNPAEKCSLLTGSQMIKVNIKGRYSLEA